MVGSPGPQDTPVTRRPPVVGVGDYRGSPGSGDGECPGPPTLDGPDLREFGGLLPQGPSTHTHPVSWFLTRPQDGLRDSPLSSWYLPLCVGPLSSRAGPPDSSVLYLHLPDDPRNRTLLRGRPPWVPDVHRGMTQVHT